MKTNKIITLILVAIIFTACNIKIEPNAVNSSEYLGKKENPANIYKQDKEAKWINPFNFADTDFGRLILVSIDKHPNIETVELVVQNNNKGAFVVVYYHNGNVETYPNSFLSINKKYLQPNKDWKLMKERDFTYIFKKTNKGLIYNLDIVIKNNTRISISVNNNSNQIKQYSFLAAVGADLSDVKRFPLIYLRQAGFLPVNKTKINFKINNVEMKPTKVPLKVENISCYKVVYSFSPQAFFWNEEQNEILNYVNIDKFQSEDISYITAKQYGHTEIKSVIYKTETHKAQYNFMPRFPDIAALNDNVNLEGKFTIDVDEIKGVIGGKYYIKKRNGKIEVSFEPENCWQPMPGKDWVSAYKYKALFSPINEQQYQISSKWAID